MSHAEALRRLEELERRYDGPIPPQLLAPVLAVLNAPPRRT